MKAFGLIVVLPIAIVLALYFIGQWFGQPDPQVLPLQ
jgi:hypothetical protein